MVLGCNHFKKIFHFYYLYTVPNLDFHLVIQLQIFTPKHHFLFQVQALNMSLSDSASTIKDLNERISQMQRALTSSEHDRRVLNEKLDATR